jgi:hypothetical protein
MRSFFIKSFLIFGLYLHLEAQESVSLQGVWKFQTDRDDVGLKEEWYKRFLLDTITLPGSMVQRGKGDELTLKTQWTGSIYDSSWFFNPRMAKYRQPGNIKFPFWLTPDKYYVGPAWYQKEVEIPKDWENKKIILYLERPHWESLVWVDGKPFGLQNSLSVPHQYDISSALTAGKHKITIRIDNRTKDINPGPDSHSITDHTQGNWNGIVGRMELIATNSDGIKDIQVFPDITNKAAKLLVLVNNSGSKVQRSLTVSATSTNTGNIQKVKQLVFPIKTSSSDTITIVYPMGDNVQFWDEFSPVLYNLSVVLNGKSKILDQKNVLFGMREIKVKGTRFIVNGKETFLRGTVENCVFPLTGYMPMDEASWIRVFNICKSFGLNHMRFHSICPPEAAFVAADKTGFYLQPEGPSWANHGSSLGDGRPIDKYIWEETERIVKEYGNHASFTFFAYGNEPRGRYVEYLNKWCIYWKNKDNRRLYTGASTGGSWKIIPESEFLVRARPRGLQWKGLPETSFDYRDRLEGQTMPYVTHEMGQWCVFPNFDEIPKYKGPLKAKNFELFKEDLSDKNMGALGKDFMMASGKLQNICYKAEIEAALRTPDLAGFQLLSLNDYSGQGTALVGLLDAFWDEKGYVAAQEFNRFCNSTVPLVRLPKFVFKNNEQLKATIEIAHFGPEVLKNVKTTWRIKNGEQTVASGEYNSESIPVGNCTNIGVIEASFTNISSPAKLVLEVVAGQYANSWDLWVYPTPVSTENIASIHVSNSLDSMALEVLKKGGNVLILCAGKVENGKDIVQYFTPVFWNTSWFKMRPPHTTGILVQSNHPVFSEFPTDYFSNYQWYELVNRQQVMNLDGFPADFKSLVQPIDTWFLNRKLGLLFEANAGNGKIMVCSADLTGKPEERIVARQLLHSIKKYMSSDKFNPEQSVDLSVIADLFEKKERKGYDSYTKDSPDELKPDHAKPKK